MTGTTTSALAEGANKYYTDARVDARINATSSIGTLTSLPNLGTVATSLSGFLKATAGVLSTALVDLTSSVTGILGVGNGGTGWASIAASAIPYGNSSGALATTTAGTGGYVLAYLNGVPTWTATTTFSAPLSYSAGAVSIPAANGSSNGYLSSGDWTTFNNKVSTTRAINTTYPLQGGGDLSADRTLSLAFGTTTANAWSLAQTFTSGFLSLASSTIGNGAQAGGLTISGGATTTGNAYFAGGLGIGTTSPFTTFGVSGTGYFTGNLTASNIFGSISSTTILATGATTARMPGDMAADVVNVKSFGARGDGVTDDSAAINAAIDYIRDANDAAGTGSINKYQLYFPQGNYKILSTINLTCLSDPNGTSIGTDDGCRPNGGATQTSETHSVLQIAGY